MSFSSFAVPSEKILTTHRTACFRMHLFLFFVGGRVVRMFVFRIIGSSFPVFFFLLVVARSFATPRCSAERNGLAPTSLPR